MRTKTLLITIFTILIIFGAFFGARVSSPDTKREKATPPVAEKENKSLANPQKRDDTKYFLTLEGNTLCAYTEELGARKLVFSRSFEPMLMSDAEIKNLKGGIYAESFEDLCLYFESYLS